MAQPNGAIINSAVSLIKTVRDPSVSNVVAAATDVVAIGNNPTANNAVTNAGPLITSTFTALTQGQPLNPLNTVNQAVKLATGFMDPKTAGLVGSVSGGLNQLFGVGGALSPASSLLGLGVGGGNKPVALHTETLPSQNMKSAYSEGKDVVFSFVRANSAMESALSEPGFGDINLGIADSSAFDLDNTAPFDAGQTLNANDTTFSPPAIGTIGDYSGLSGGVR